MLVSANWLEGVPTDVVKDEALPLTHPAPDVGPRVPTLDLYGMTDVGNVRERNEDSFLIARLNRWMQISQSSLPVPGERRDLLSDPGELFMVADGVGGHGSGDLASAVAIDAVAERVLRVTPWVFEPGYGGTEEQRDAMVGGSLQQALAFTEGQVHAVAEQRGLVDQKMATTLTVALVLWPRLYIAHVGDSRAYVCRNGQLRRVTRDHTLGEQVGAANGAFKHVLVNAVGGADSKLLVEIHRVMLEPGDAVMLCTDGLTNELTDEQIAGYLSQAPGSREAAEILVHAAKTAGGHDNVTAVVAMAGQLH
jgi:serine/threonine protein phosphatase PrpC